MQCPITLPAIDNLLSRSGMFGTIIETHKLPQLLRSWFPFKISVFHRDSNEAEK